MQITRHAIASFRGLVLLIAGLALAATLSGCASPVAESDNNHVRTASDFIGQPRPMP